MRSSACRTYDDLGGSGVGTEVELELDIEVDRASVGLDDIGDLVHSHWDWNWN